MAVTWIHNVLLRPPVPSGTCDVLPLRHLRLVQHGHCAQVRQSMGLVIFTFCRYTLTHQLGVVEQASVRMSLSLMLVPCAVPGMDSTVFVGSAVCRALIEARPSPSRASSSSRCESGSRRLHTNQQRLKNPLDYPSSVSM